MWRQSRWTRRAEIRQGRKRNCDQVPPPGGVGTAGTKSRDAGREARASNSAEKGRSSTLTLRAAPVGGKLMMLSDLQQLHLFCSSLTQSNPSRRKCGWKGPLDRHCSWICDEWRMHFYMTGPSGDRRGVAAAVAQRKNRQHIVLR